MAEIMKLNSKLHLQHMYKYAFTSVFFFNFIINRCMYDASHSEMHGMIAIIQVLRSIQLCGPKVSVLVNTHAKENPNFFHVILSVLHTSGHIIL